MFERAKVAVLALVGLISFYSSALTIAGSSLPKHAGEADASREVISQVGAKMAVTSSLVSIAGAF
jgi:hypothetical protein